MKKTRDQDELLLLALVEMFKQPNPETLKTVKDTNHLSWFLWQQSEQGAYFWREIFNTNPLTY